MARLIWAGVVLALAMGSVPAEAKKKPKPVAAAPVPPPPSVKQGVELWRAGDYAGAVAMWQPFADAGDVDAMFNIGQAYKLGRAVPKDSLIARDWYRKAAAKGHLPAEANLGILLFQAGDKQEAIRWLKMAADQNEMRAQYVLGVALWNGDGVPKNMALAYAYLSRSSAQGLPDAQSALNSLTAVIAPVDRANGWAASTSLAAGKGIPPNLGGPAPAITYAGNYERFNREDVQKLPPKPEVVTAQAVPVTPSSAVTAPAAPPKAAPPAMAMMTSPQMAPPVQGPPLATPPSTAAATATAPVLATAAPAAAPKPVAPATVTPPAPKPVVVAAAPPRPVERPLAPPVAIVAIPAAEPPKVVETVAAKPVPAKVEAARAEPPKAKPKPVETAAAEPPPKPKPTGWRVQLGAFSERQKAEAAWTDVKSKQKALVANTKPIYEASGNVTKLQIGPYPTKTAAKDACAKIAFSGRACFVTEG